MRIKSLHLDSYKRQVEKIFFEDISGSPDYFTLLESELRKGDTFVFVVVFSVDSFQKLN